MRATLGNNTDFTMSATTILELDGVSKRYGGIRALEDVSISLDEGEFIGLIGPNGAGKTTLINTIMGLTTPDEGSVRIHGQNSLTTVPHERFDLGVTKTFQETGLFMNLTVQECVLVGLKRDTSLGSAFQTPDDETLVYPVEGGQWVQTTLSFWADILAAREPLYNQPLGESPETLEVSRCGAN